MYEKNILTNVVQKIKVNEDIRSAIIDQLSTMKKIHSVIAYAVVKNQVMKGWEIHYNISQSKKFNTLRQADYLSELITHVEGTKDITKSGVIYYKQPLLEILILQFNPLVKKLAKEQKEHWEQLEYDDLYQMCRLCMCNLYYKGYYLHKGLISRTFNNYVLQHIYKDRNKPDVISLDQEYSKHDDDERVTIADMIPDIYQVYKREDEEDDIVEQQILKEMREIVIDYIGPRQYDQLLREYGNKSTTAWSRKLMQQIKARLFELGINRKSFNKYHN